MNTAEKTSGHLNPINRDLAIVFAIGFLIAVAIVTMGIVLLNQL
ncbi:MAG TPA: hypothetical protein PK185_15445 [Cyclobacteriaceae bacterium]|jgi:hypothetical protein|nr:hypothetical protein [Cyclobacteriaceae bacterium]